MKSQTRKLNAALALVLSITALLYARPLQQQSQQQSPQQQSQLSGPPQEAGPFRQPELVELVRLDPSLRLDIHYATKKNFTGRPVYREARAFLQRPAAEALVRVNAALRRKGYGLVIFDGYRPWSVTKAFWDLTPVDKKQFVADPQKGSRHNRGCAVDLTMFELSTGREVQMPSEYDEMTERSHINYQCATAEAKALRETLRAAMEAEGFNVYEPEWWHYDYKDWKQYPILNLKFSEIGKKNSSSPRRQFFGKRYLRIGSTRLAHAGSLWRAPANSL